MKANTKPDDFGLPKEVIERSRMLHQKGPKVPLEKKRQVILGARRNTKKILSPWTIGLGAVAALLLGIIFLQGIQNQASTSAAHTYASMDQEDWIIDNYASPFDKDAYLYDINPKEVEEINWSWASNMAMQEEEIDLLIEKWSLEMTENEFYNLYNL